MEGPPALTAAAREAEAAAAEQPPRLVVLLALGLAGEHVVGLGHLLEARSASGLPGFWSGWFSRASLR